MQPKVLPRTRHHDRRAPQVEPEPPGRAGDPDHGLVARGAAQDGAQLDGVEPKLRHGRNLAQPAQVVRAAVASNAKTSRSRPPAA